MILIFISYPKDVMKISLNHIIDILTVVHVLSKNKDVLFM